MAFQLGFFSKRLPFFARLGAVSGAIVAGVYEYLSISTSIHTWADVLQATSFATLLAWSATCILFGVWLRFTIAQIFFQSLLVALLTSIVLLALLRQWPSGFDVLVGFLVGILIGLILNWICKLLSPRSLPTRTAE